MHIFMYILYIAYISCKQQIDPEQTLLSNRITINNLIYSSYMYVDCNI